MDGKEIWFPHGKEVYAVNMIAFDIEIARQVTGDDWSSFRPLGITCAAVCGEDLKPIVFHGGKGVRDYAPCMTPYNARKLVEYLSNKQIVTLNGLGFDFDILAEETQDPAYAKICKKLALDSIDIGFQIFCERGFMLGLDTMAKGLGLPGKTEGMDGAKAPALWAQGRFGQEKVIEYVGQDVITTMQVYLALLEKKRLTWTTKKGTPAKDPWVPIIREGRLLTVRECLKLPLPDQSWMDNPWSREKFTAWLSL